MTGGLGFTTLMKGLFKRNTELLKYTRNYKNKKNKLNYKIGHKIPKINKPSKDELANFTKKFQRKTQNEYKKALLAGIFLSLVLSGIIIYLFFNYLSN